MKTPKITINLLTFLIILGFIAAMLPAQIVRGQSSTIVLKPVADATVNKSSPSRKFGSRPLLQVDGSPITRSYLRFDVNGLNGGKITNAKLRLYVVDDSHSGFTVAQVSSNSWSESQINFKNAPSVGNAIGSIGSYGSGIWIEIDLTGAVSSEGELSLALTTTADTTTALSSREAGANAPQLVLLVETSTTPAPTTTSPAVPTATKSPTSVVTATKAPTAAPTVAPTIAPTVAPTQPSSQPMPYGQIGSWSLKWSDEFNGTSLDLNKWEPNWLAGNNTAITKPINGAELSCYDPAQVSVANGSLKLSAVARNCTANNGTTYNYASGIVTSRQDYTFSYGYMEARVWLDGTSIPKNWAAFWADGTGQWPTTGEIDVMEGLNGKLSWHYHWGTTSNHQSTGGYPSMSSSVGWHIFAADWQAGAIKFYYDGVYVGQTTTGVVSGPMFLILNYGVSSTISPPVQVPSTFLVDYVRVWQKN